jgi:hypothetical protein
VNYLLRGMRVPAGDHKIEFRFEPTSYSLGSTSALICSSLILAFLGFAIWWSIKNPEKKEESEIATEVETTPIVEKSTETKPKKK